MLFEAVPVQIPKILKKLSTDQQYLYDICQAVSTGSCSQSLANRYPGMDVLFMLIYGNIIETIFLKFNMGNLSHSRWLTTANSVLRLYVSTAEPSETLNLLVTFIMRVYAPMWFKIKKYHACSDVAKNVWMT